MTIAERKKSENIAEYIIYIWQMEDLLRAAQFDLEVIGHFVKAQVQGEDLMNEMKWFEALSRQMKQQNIISSGNTYEIQELITEMEFLHSSLLTVYGDHQYEKLYNLAKPNIQALESKVGEKRKGEIENCLSALYGVLVLRLKGETISKETQLAIETFSAFLSKLSQRFRQMKSGDLKLNMN